MRPNRLTLTINCVSLVQHIAKPQLSELSFLILSPDPDFLVRT